MWGWIISAVLAIALVAVVIGVVWFLRGIMPSGGEWHGGSR